MIQLYIYILFQILFPYRLLQDIELVPCAVQSVLVVYLFLFSYKATNSTGLSKAHSYQLL